MRSLAVLRRDAASTTSRRGHRMNWEYSKRDYADPRCSAIGTCVRCGAWVQIMNDPAPNQIDIGGTAVAVDCKVVEEHDPTNCALRPTSAKRTRHRTTGRDER